MSGVALTISTAETVGPPRVGAKRFWTGREQMILRNAYPQSGIAGSLALLPGRSAAAIYVRAMKLKLVSPHEATRRRCRPTEQIDDAIRRVYQNNTDKGAIKRLAQTTGRSRAWIRARAIALGIAVPRFKEPPWTEAETEIVAEAAHLKPAA